MLGGFDDLMSDDNVSTRNSDRPAHQIGRRRPSESTRSQPMSKVPVRVVGDGVWKVSRPTPNTGWSAVLK